MYTKYIPPLRSLQRSCFSGFSALLFCMGNLQFGSAQIVGPGG